MPHSAACRRCFDPSKAMCLFNGPTGVPSTRDVIASHIVEPTVSARPADGPAQ